MRIGQAYLERERDEAGCPDVLAYTNVLLKDGTDGQVLARYVHQNTDHIADADWLIGYEFSVKEADISITKRDHILARHSHTITILDTRFKARESS